MIEKSKKYVIMYAQDSREIDFFNREFRGHLYNSLWFKHFEKNENLKLIYEQEKPEEGYTTAQFFVFEKTSQGEK